MSLWPLQEASQLASSIHEVKTGGSQSNFSGQKYLAERMRVKTGGSARPSSPGSPWRSWHAGFTRLKYTLFLSI